MAKRNGGIIGPDNVPAGPLGAAKGVWRLEDAFNYQKAGLWPVVLGYQIPNSARFNSGSTDYLQRTQGSGDTQKFTFSAWVKKSGNTGYSGLLNAYSSNSNRASIYFSSDEAFSVYLLSGGSDQILLQSSALYRDLSAWYHVVIAVDTTQATSANRAKMYVNGTQITSFQSETYPSQNANFSTINVNGQSIQIGNLQYGSVINNYYSGYMSEINFIDGQQLTPSSFGQTDSTTGIWTPKAYTGTYGTNGFYLNFANSADLGNDVSGNNNDFTVNNLTSVDQSTDSPTNNFCILNPLVQAGSVTSGATYTYSNGNITITASGNKWVAPYGSFGLTRGKWYYEMKLTTFASPTGSPVRVGWGALDDVVKDNEVYFRGLTYDLGNGNLVAGSGGTGGNVLTGQTTFAQGNIVGVAIDLTNNTISYYKNGTITSISNYDYSGVNTDIKSSLGYNNAPQIVFYGDNSASNILDLNFGSPSYAANSYTDANGFGNFSYAVPSGYYSLCTKNLAIYG